MPRRPDLSPLSRAQLRQDPMEQFAVWFERALTEAPLAEAMSLATVDEAGRPDARMVLLKGFGPAGFRFFTNYESAKGEQLAAAPAAAIVVYWRELDRQVRARGTVERLSGEDSDAYFAGRPRDAQLGAWASPQSHPIPSRGELEGRVDDAGERFGSERIPRPPHWGGYVLRPESVEFWQGEAARLHDRFRYTRDADGWRIERLAP
jgi:pyridoxamine 5'-phosphate oxidase